MAEITVEKAGVEDINFGTGTFTRNSRMGPGNTTLNQVSAHDVPIADAGGIITAVEVEAALQEIQTALDVAEASLVIAEADIDTLEATTLLGLTLELTNKTGGSLAVNDLVRIDNGNASAVEAIVESEDAEYVVATETITNNSLGTFRRLGAVTTKVTGSGSIGDFAYASGTAKNAKALSYKGTGAFGVFLSAPAAGVATILLFGKTHSEPVGVSSECRLEISGANLVFKPVGMGDRVPLKSANGWFLRQIPTAGVTLSTSGLAVDTTYDIYLFDSAGTLTLEASVTARATDTDTGVEIKGGDATRTLVGKARTDNPLGWESSATKRFVISWFNRQWLSGEAAFTANRTSVSGTFAEINTEIKVNALSWGTEDVFVQANGACANSGAGNVIETTIQIGGTNQDGGVRSDSPVLNNFIPFACQATRLQAEGSFNATLMGLTSAGTATWLGSGTVGQRTTLRVLVRG